MPSIIDQIDARNRKIRRQRTHAYKLSETTGAMDGPSAAVIGTDDNLMTASAVISTPAKDRGGDAVSPLGCVLTNYIKNPVVLLSHGITPYPVGVAEIGGVLQVFPESARVWATCRFAQSVPEGPATYALVKEGILRGTSIGFQPIVATKIRPEPGSPNSMEVFGYAISQWELLEFSWVSVPMNPGAIRLGWRAEKVRRFLDKGTVNGERLTAPMVKMLSPLAARPKGLFRVTPKGKKMADEVKPEEEAKATGTDVQAVKLSKETFPTEEEAKAACEKLGYKTDTPEHEEMSWKYVQFSADELEGEATETDLKDGLRGIVGTRNQDAAYAANGKEGEPEAESIDDDAVTEEPIEEPTRKAGEIFLEALANCIGEMQDLLASAEATQERTDILEAAPAWLEASEALKAEVESMAGSGEKKKEEGSEEEADDETEKAFRSVWTAGKASEKTANEIVATMALLKKAYTLPLAGSLKAEMKQRYAALKSLASGSVKVTPVGLNSDAILAAIKTNSDKLAAGDKRLAALTGGLV